MLAASISDKLKTALRDNLKMEEREFQNPHLSRHSLVGLGTTLVEDLT